MDLKRALFAYVTGRNGGWDSELKSPTAAPTADATPPAELPPTGIEPVPHNGVPVPLRLGFERGPGMWRSRLEDESRS